jgi:hypothetical protein
MAMPRMGLARSCLIFPVQRHLLLLIQGGAPTACDTRRITLYPVGIKPVASAFSGSSVDVHGLVR